MVIQSKRPTHVLYGEAFNNQTITKLRLQWYLEDSYSSVLERL